MPRVDLSRRLQVLAAETVAAGSGRHDREDPVLPGTGGPAGNARLTAWVGLLLLVLFLAELVTLLDVHGLISWHLAVGALLIPPAVLKTGTTGWRIVRYYAGDRGYRAAGPPPTLLRVLGPLVVISTWAVLATGVALVIAGPQSSRSQLMSVLGQRVDAITLHQGSFAGWAVVTGLHTLGRLLPAVRTVLPGDSTSRRVPGRRVRLVAVVLTALLAVVTAVVLVRGSNGWQHDQFRHFRRPPDGLSQSQ
jgi:putative Ca2+/H+ antiporter (TMEM165/GDT1 family)